MKFNFGVLVIIFLFTTEVFIEVHQEIKGFEFPYYFYIFVYYLRAILSLLCIYCGVVRINNKTKNGFYYLIIGLLFSFLSIVPSIISLYMFNSTDLFLLRAEEQRAYEDHINQQKYLLLIISSVAIILASVFYMRRKKVK